MHTVTAIIASSVGFQGALTLKFTREFDSYEGTFEITNPAGSVSGRLGPTSAGEYEAWWGKVITKDLLNDAVIRIEIDFDRPLTSSGDGPVRGVIEIVADGKERASGEARVRQLIVHFSNPQYL